MNIFLNIMKVFSNFFEKNKNQEDSSTEHQLENVINSLPKAENKLDTAERIVEPVLPAKKVSATFEEKLKDRRAFASKEHDYGSRKWKDVTGICLHQTACNLGEKPARWDTVGCHVGVTRNGQVIWLHNFDRLIVHGNGWNKKTVGIEIDGMYEGVKGDIKTFWRDKSDKKSQPQNLTSETVAAVNQLIEFICSEVEKAGGKIEYLVAHRQASENRRNDPGSEIWQMIAIPMSKKLSLSDGGDGFKIGSGYAIPREWDNRYKTKY